MRSLLILSIGWPFTFQILLFKSLALLNSFAARSCLNDSLAFFFRFFIFLKFDYGYVQIRFFPLACDSGQESSDDSLDPLHELQIKKKRNEAHTSRQDQKRRRSSGGAAVTASTLASSRRVHVSVCAWQQLHHALCCGKKKSSSVLLAAAASCVRSSASSAGPAASRKTTAAARCSELGGWAAPEDRCGSRSSRCMSAPGRRRAGVLLVSGTKRACCSSRMLAADASARKRRRFQHHDTHDVRRRPATPARRRPRPGRLCRGQPQPQYPGSPS